MRSASYSQMSDSSFTHCWPWASVALVGLTMIIGVATGLVYLLNRPATTTAAAVAEHGGAHAWEVPHTQCALNMSAVPPCEPASKGSNFAFKRPRTGPCSWQKALVTPPSDNTVGPWRCETPRVVGRQAVMSGTYRLSPDASRIVVERPGLYMAIAHVTFRHGATSDDAFTVSLAVNDQARLLCTANPGPSRPRPRPGAYAYASCSVSGLLSLQPGDAVWLTAPRFGAPVEVVSLQPATRLEILRLDSPLG